MTKLSEASNSSINNFIEETNKKILNVSCLEDAAQKLTDSIYQEYKDSIVLTRVFATVPYGKLPAANQTFVDKLAVAKNIKNLITSQTLVLSLLGTSGVETAWNNRRYSLGHVGIPLVSADFINLIPMISRLMKALDIPLDWISSSDINIVSKAIGRLAGVFYISDAKTTLDEQKRNIIAAQDFVNKYTVKTVFGLGGGYLTQTTFITLILFTRETIDKSKAEQFLPLIHHFKGATNHCISADKIFK